MKVDIFKYAGQVTMTGYEMLCEQIGSVKGNGSERALLIIATPGGDPDAGFRIARSLSDFPTFRPETPSETIGSEPPRPRR